MFNSWKGLRVTFFFKVSYHFKCLHAEDDVHSRESYAQISKECIFQESRASALYHLVARAWHGHTKCGARHKTKTFNWILSYSADHTFWFIKICQKVFYRDLLLMLCLSLQISFQRDVEWKYSHVIDIMPACENGLCWSCSGLFWRLRLLSILAVSGKINIGGQLYLLVVIGQLSARHILLHVRSAKISCIFHTMAKISRGLPSSVFNCHDK